MIEAYVGIDVAYAKKKRLPVVVCVRRDDVLEALPLRLGRVKPPAGEGNARLLDGGAADTFASQTIDYLRAVEAEYGVQVARIAIDAPSEPRPARVARRRAEVALDRQRISCITTPDSDGFASMRDRGLAHLAHGGPESRLPGANQLWMLVGFALFRALGRSWECLEVFPQATARVLGVSGIHKSKAAGLRAQLQAVAWRTGWPRGIVSGETDNAARPLKPIAFGSPHDQLDAYTAAWVASLDEASREPFGVPPGDAIWVPRVGVAVQSAG